MTITMHREESIHIFVYDLALRMDDFRGQLSALSKYKLKGRSTKKITGGRLAVGNNRQSVNSSPGYAGLF